MKLIISIVIIILVMITVALKNKEVEPESKHKLLQEGVEEGTNALQSFVNLYPKEEIYSITLYVDNDVSSAYMCVNTLEGLERICPDMEESRDYYYYKYNPAEWERRLIYPLNTTNELIEEDYERKDKEFNELKFERIRLLTEYLDLVKVNVCKLEKLDNIVVFVNIGDAYTFEIDGILKSAKEFNSDYGIREILKYYNRELS